MLHDNFGVLTEIVDGNTDFRKGIETLEIGDQDLAEILDSARPSLAEAWNINIDGRDQEYKIVPTKPNVTTPGPPEGVVSKWEQDNYDGEINSLTIIEHHIREVIEYKRQVYSSPRDYLSAHKILQGWVKLQAEHIGVTVEDAAVYMDKVNKIINFVIMADTEFPGLMDKFEEVVGI